MPHHHPPGAGQVAAGSKDRINAPQSGAAAAGELRGKKGASEFPALAKAVLIRIVCSAVASFIAYTVVGLAIGLRVSEEDEREGLDITSHGETAYNR